MAAAKQASMIDCSARAMRLENLRRLPVMRFGEARSRTLPSLRVRLTGDWAWGIAPLRLPPGMLWRPDSYRNTEPSIQTSHPCESHIALDSWSMGTLSMSGRILEQHCTFLNILNADCVLSTP